MIINDLLYILGIGICLAPTIRARHRVSVLDSDGHPEPRGARYTMKADTLKRRNGLVAAALAAVLIPAFGLVACDSGVTGTQDARTSVTLSQAGSGSAALASQVMATRTDLSQVSLDAVTSIVVQINRVEVHRAGATDDEENGGGQPAWVSLNVEEQELDLINDLADGTTVTIAEGELSAGDYDQVRLFIEGATIVFSEPQPVPGEGDQTVSEAQLTIPSVGQTGIKVPGASFTVGEDAGATVDIEFDADTSVQNITITGTGDVKMNPVLVSGGVNGSA
jgi:hypothetical protein